MEDMLAKIGIKIGYLVTGFLGGAIALLFGVRPKNWRDKLKAVLFVISGAILTGFVTPLVLKWAPNWAGVEYSIGFVVGLMGMGILRDIFIVIRDFGKNPMEYLRMIRGGKKE